MTIQENFKKDELLVIALHLIALDNATVAGFSLEGTVSKICLEAGVNRTQVYEKKAQLVKLFQSFELPGPGRTPQPKTPLPDRDEAWNLQVTLLRYRLENPGAFIQHPGGRTGYSFGFIRTVLNLLDDWTGTLEQFCEITEVPYPTMDAWRKKDAKMPYEPAMAKPVPHLGPDISDITRMIVEDYACWQGSIGDFLAYEPKRVGLSPNQVRKVLTITGMIGVRNGTSPRYRGSTEKLQPGTVLVTDGKEVAVQLTSSNKTRKYNWQGIVDQATACHTAVVVTETETAEGVRQAYEESVDFIGRKPQALIHDNKPNKPIHKERQLRETIEPETVMIATTPARPENKAVIEGEFGKFEQTVGPIVLDDSNTESLVKSAIEEVIRAYTAGINHAGRYELDGLSRQQVLRRACPDPEKDSAFLENLKARQELIRKPDRLPTMAVARNILDEGFTDFNLEHLDPKGSLRTWLSSRYTPAAIRQGLAIFGTERLKGRLASDTAHRYLVKVIQNCQDELDLRVQETLLKKYAETERRGLLYELEKEYELLLAECQLEHGPANDLALRLSEKAVFGGLVLQRSFWEDKLKALLMNAEKRTEAVIRHIRRLFEAEWNDRFQLISRLISWNIGVAA